MAIERAAGSDGATPSMLKKLRVQPVRGQAGTAALGTTAAVLPSHLSAVRPGASFVSAAAHRGLRPFEKYRLRVATRQLSTSVVELLLARAVARRAEADPRGALQDTTAALRCVA